MPRTVETSASATSAISPANAARFAWFGFVVLGMIVRACVGSSPSHSPSIPPFPSFNPSSVGLPPFPTYKPPTIDPPSLTWLGTEPRAESCEILASGWWREDDGHAHWELTVRNTGRHVATGVPYRSIYFDAAGKEIGRSDGWLMGDMAPGATAHLRFDDVVEAGDAWAAYVAVDRNQLTPAKR